MPSKITDVGRALIAARLAGADTVDITRVKFGAPVFADPNNPPAPDGTELDVASLQHTVNGGITGGYINPDQAAFTAFLDASVGDFDITQVGFFDVRLGVETLVMLANVPPVRKTANAGNNYKHTEVLSIQDAAEATGVSIPAATWQLDHTARFRTVEDELKADVARLLGRFAALSGAMLVSEIAPTLREDCEDTAGWAASSGAAALDAVDFTQGAGSVEVSGHAADAELTHTLGVAQDWSAANGVLVDILSTLASNIAFFIEDSLGNRSYWNLVSQVAWYEHEALLGAPDGNNGADADLTDVLKFGLQGLDNGVTYNVDNIRTARLNDFALAAGDAILEGIGRDWPATTYATHLSDWNGDPTAPVGLVPPGAGTRTDGVYLDVWVEGDGSSVAVRGALIVSDAAQADYIDGAGIQHRVEKLADIERTTAQRITAAMLTDARRDITVATTGALQSRDERAQVNGYADLDGAGLLPLARLPAVLAGKDADTLDGEEGAFYRNADNLNAGTVPLAQIPASVELTANKGAANGYAGLDATAKMPLSQLPGKRCVQRVVATKSTSQTSTTTTFADYLAQAFTPLYADSEIVVRAVVQAGSQGTSTTTTRTNAMLARDATQLGDIHWTSGGTAGDNAQVQASLAFEHVEASPGTSAVSYKLRMARDSGGGTSYCYNAVLVIEEWK